MLCDQASDKTFFHYQTGLAGSTKSFYDIKASLSIPRVKINPGHSPGLCLGCTTQHTADPEPSDSMLVTVYSRQSAR